MCSFFGAGGASVIGIIEGKIARAVHSMLGVWHEVNFTAEASREMGKGAPHLHGVPLSSGLFVTQANVLA